MNFNNGCGILVFTNQQNRRGKHMNTCLVCNKEVGRANLTPLHPIPLLGLIESEHGWVAHSDCLFRLLLHPDNEFMGGMCSVNGLDIHTECYDARVTCVNCQPLIAEALGLPSCVFKMLKAYILRLEKGTQYKHDFE